MSNSWPSEVADETLLQEAVQHAQPDRRRRAASELLGRYSGRVLDWCRRYGRDEDDARDIAQTALIRAYENLASFEGRSKFSSWLFAVTRTTCLNAVKKESRRRDEPIEDDASLVDHGPTPEERLMSIQAEEHRWSVLRDVLDDEEQTAMVLRYGEQMLPDEITRAMKLTSKSGARGLLQRARRKLATHFEQVDGGESNVP